MRLEKRLRISECAQPAGAHSLAQCADGDFSGRQGQQKTEPGLRLALDPVAHSHGVLPETGELAVELVERELRGQHGVADVEQLPVFGVHVWPDLVPQVGSG